MQAKRISHVVLGALLCATAAHADVTPGDEYLELIKQASHRAPLGSDLFGDQTNLYTGSTAFVATDVSLPGNSELPVAFSRRLDIDGSTSLLGKGALADWWIDIPHLSGTFATSTGWAVSADDAASMVKRCSVQAGAPGVSFQYVDFSPREYWRGNSLHLPDGDSELLTYRSTQNPNKPTTAADYKWVTSGNWYFSCLASTENGIEGEAFLGQAPDGKKYWFNHVASWQLPSLHKPSDVGPLSVAAAGDVQIALANGGLLPRREVWMMPTRVEDRFGNWVTYTYDAANPGNVTKIEASDGRRIDIAYNTDGRVQTVTANGRVWNYVYDGLALAQVVLPDGSSWTYDLQPLVRYNLSSVSAILCENGAAPTTEDVTGTIAHPSGATGSFTFHQHRLGRSNVPKNCIEDYGSDYFYSYYPLYFDVFGMVSKRIQGPGVSASWSFDYGTANASWSSACGTGCVKTRVVTVSQPDGTKRYTYGTAFRDTEGRLLSTQTLDGAGNLVRTEATTYKYPASGDLYPAKFGGKVNEASDGLDYWMPQAKRTISQDGSSFTWSASAFDKLSRPTVVTRAGPTATRTETTTYYDDGTHWVLGQIAQFSVDGTVAEATNYNNYGQAASVSKFGRLSQQLGYDMGTAGALGRLSQVKDGNGDVTTVGSWKRGVPQLVTFADGRSRRAAVDDNGWITSLTNEAGYATSYAYDKLGRVAAITYPAGDSTGWNATKFAFVQVASSEYGLAAGHWRESESTGNRQKFTYYDAMMRPLLVREYDASDQAATERFSRFEYDYAGRQTFAAYPATASTASTGSWTEYDVLGRTTSVSQDSEKGVLTTLTQYLSGSRTIVTNPAGKQTQTTYQAFDTPSYDAPTTILQPESTRTDIARDVFGNVLKITRGIQ